jgi:multisubunit Na+/H+ antiporter MnhF subunit
MNEWLIGATALAFALIPCLGVALFTPAPSGLVALEIAGVLVATILMLLAEGFHRQPFIDLAVVLAPMALMGALIFARLMERQL